MALHWYNRRRNRTRYSWGMGRQSSASHEWWQICSRTTPAFADVLIFRRFPFAHCDGFLVPSPRCKIECSTACLRWLRRPWVTEITFVARRASPVEFRGSWDAMAAPGQELSRKLLIIKFERSAPKLSQKYYCTLARLCKFHNFYGHVRVKATLEGREDVGLPVHTQVIIPDFICPTCISCMCTV